MKRSANLVRVFSLVSALSALAARSIEAQTVVTLYSFPMLALQPQGPLVLASDGNFYGTTYEGGVQNQGTVFKLTPTGVATILHSFGALNDGYFPEAGLVQGSDGNLYGTTFAGGNRGNNGTVFKITPTGDETVIFSFGGTDGSSPDAPLVQGSDGNFYGTTFDGGNYNGGTVFKITPAGAQSVLYSFGGNSSDGKEPEAALVEGNDGNFYGVTESGGGSQNYGTVFEITPSGEEAILYRFGTNPNDDYDPRAALVQGSDGNFYGTVTAPGSGAIFMITPSGTETILHRFSGPSDGHNPLGALIEGSDGNFYGTTYSGGSHGHGTVYMVTPSGAETVLYQFGANPTDGAQLFGGLVRGSDGNFYGTASAGGLVSEGTAFMITPSGVETALYQFGTNPNDGAAPQAPLVEGSDGNLYGTTSGGGGYGLGAVFKITSAGTETLLYSFAGYPNDGSSPQAALAEGSDGNFYGTTYSGGSKRNGTVFKITPSGTETVLYSFGANSGDGSQPQAALVQGSDGSFYGTCSGGGKNNGTVFKITPLGAQTVLYHFGTNPHDGTDPLAALIQGNDGNFYSTTFYGGTGNGAVFEITPAGTETVLYRFGTNPNDSSFPAAPLVLGNDGNFYGTISGTTTGYVFMMTPSGTETILHAFGGFPSDGGGSYAALVQGGDGNFYGTTEFGGSRNSGTVFKITPSGTETMLYSFGTSPNDGVASGSGAVFLSGLTAGSDGNLYGTTQFGGAGSQGVVFKVTLSSPQLVAAAAHTGALTQGDAADTLTIQVSNTGNAPTVGVVTVIDTIPAGLTLSGSNQGTINGWSVNLSGQALTATRSDALQAGHAYPALPIRVSVDDDASASVTNSVNVLGGGEIFAGNNSGSDAITIGLSALNTWRQTYFPGSTSTNGPGADLSTPKNDGVTNLVKFATGLDPSAPAAAPGVIAMSNGKLNFIYTPSTGAVASGFSFVVEYCDALGANAWAPDLVDQGDLGSGGSPVTATLPMGPNGRRFVHLKVTKP